MEEKGFRPGVMSVVQTFGDRANFHPHVHALVSRGGWTACGEWMPVPYVDEGAAERLFRYMMRPPVSLSRMRFTPGSHEVVYARKGGHDEPEPTEGERIDAMEFLARVLVQIPDPKRHLVRYYTLMLARLRRGDRPGAVRGMLVWAAALALFGTLAFAFWPTPPDALVLNGPAYRDEMLQWIRTGEGREGSPLVFLPQHVVHLGLFVGLSLVTASMLSILLGAVLVNHMDFCVASLARAGAPLWAVVFLGWQPRALCRVAAFCTLGAVLAEPLLRRLRPYPRTGSARPYLGWASAGILADWILKAALAPTWGEWLRRLLPWL